MNIVTERPQVPSDYGYATGPKGMLEWEVVREALTAAKVYWIGTIRPDGAPHVHPIWGGWVGHHLYFEGGETTRWAKNLAKDPRVGFGAEVGGLHISGRGVAERAPAGDDFEALVANYGSKYQYKPQTDAFCKVTPDAVIAIDMTSLEDFASSPTRFRFEK